MGVFIIIALLAAAAAGASDDKKKTPTSPKDGSGGTSKDGSGGTIDGSKPIFPADKPSDDVSFKTPVETSPKATSATTDPGSSVKSLIDSRVRKFTDLDRPNPASEGGDWPGIKGLPQPHRNLALNVTSDVIYKSLSGPGPLCWNGTCSSEAVSGAIKAIDAAIDLMKYPQARRELWGAFYRLRDAGR